MEPFRSLSAPACPLGLPNVDTDQLIPARFMQTPRDQGYGRFLLHDLRRDASGALDPAFPLNDERFAKGGALIAGSNFGCGSSREAAVYVLVDSGLRCVIAPRFGDIFASNAAKNGLLTAMVSDAELTALLADPDVREGRNVSVDLETQTIRTGKLSVAFDIRPDRKQRLLNGWSDVDMTLSHRAAIDDFVMRDRVQCPWAQTPALRA